MPDPIIIDDPEPQRYYDWMLWKMRQEDKAMKEQNTTQVDTEVINQLAYVTAEEKKGEIFDGCNLYFSDSACILHCELNNNVIT